MCKQIDHFPEDADYEADASEYFLREFPPLHHSLYSHSLLCLMIIITSANWRTDLPKNLDGGLVLTPDRPYKLLVIIQIKWQILGELLTLQDLVFFNIFITFLGNKQMNLDEKTSQYLAVTEYNTTEMQIHLQYMSHPMLMTWCSYREVGEKRREKARRLPSQWPQFETAFKQFC